MNDVDEITRMRTNKNSEKFITYVRSYWKPQSSHLQSHSRERLKIDSSALPGTE